MGGDRGVRWESDDRVVVDDASFALMNEPARPGELRLFKPRVMVEAYEPVIDEFQGADILELGIYSGGSTGYLAKRCDPRTLVAIDRSIERVADLDDFIDAQGFQDQVVLHYGVDQGDRDRLRAIVAESFGDRGIGLVIDDASHRYHPTVASFEVLFPHLVPGGLYIIEDWTADDWLGLWFGDMVTSEEPIARALIIDLLTDVLNEPDNMAGSTFVRWISVTLDDPTAVHHAAASTWWAGLEGPDASAKAQVIRDVVRRRVLAGDADEGAPTLGTLGLQLLLAVKGLHPGIAEVTVTPWWIAVRRGGPFDPETFTVESIGRDTMGVMATHAAGHRDERAEQGGRSEAGDQPDASSRSTPPMMSG